MKSLQRALAVILLVPTILVSAASAEPFRIVVMPDTQWAVMKWPELVDAMTEWIAKNKDELNIEYVLHVGDIVQTGSNENEWQRFDISMRTLEKAGVPYILAAGNHDFNNLKTGDLTLFNQHFPVQRFSGRSSFGGSFPPGTNNNSYHTFRAGGVNWLILSLAFHPADDVLAWSDQVVAAHPHHEVMLLTHHYLEHRGRDKPGENMWNKLVRRRPNVPFVFCGHLSTVHFADKSDHGNTVYQMLFDWQNDKEPDNNSYLAIITMDPDEKKVSVKSYSPALDKFKTDARAEFAFDKVAFMQRAAAETVAVGVNAKDEGE